MFLQYYVLQRGIWGELIEMPNGGLAFLLPDGSIHCDFDGDLQELFDTVMFFEDDSTLSLPGA